MKPVHKILATVVALIVLVTGLSIGLTVWWGTQPLPDSLVAYGSDVYAELYDRLPAAGLAVI